MGIGEGGWGLQPLIIFWLGNLCPTRRGTLQSVQNWRGPGKAISKNIYIYNYTQSI